MLHRAKLRIEAILLLVGSILAIASEVLNLGNNDPTQKSWFLPMILVALGALPILSNITGILLFVSLAMLALPFLYPTQIGSFSQRVFGGVTRYSQTVRSARR